MAFIKKLFIWCVLGALFYVILSYHFIFIKSTVKVLPKSRRTLKYTFYSAKGKNYKTILAIDDLWDAGIADLLVEMGVMTKKELQKYEDEYFE